MLLFLYCLYQKSSKKLLALKEFRALGENIMKPVKAAGTIWIVHCYKTMEILLKHYRAYMTSDASRLFARPVYRFGHRNTSAQKKLFKFFFQLYFNKKNMLK